MRQRRKHRDELTPDLEVRDPSPHLPNGARTQKVRKRPDDSNTKIPPGQRSSLGPSSWTTCLPFLLTHILLAILLASSINLPPVSALRGSVSNPYTNTKVFVHNRTNLEVLKLWTTSSTPNPNSTRSKGSKTKGKTKTKKPSNNNNFYATSINILNGANDDVTVTPVRVTSSSSLKINPRPSKTKTKGKTKGDSDQLLRLPLFYTTSNQDTGQGQGEGSPTRGPITLHPLSVLKTDLVHTPTDPSSSKARSNFAPEGIDLEDDDPDPKNNTNGLDLKSSKGTTKSDATTSGKKFQFQSNLFDNFEDHWEDPIAQESTAPMMMMGMGHGLPTTAGTFTSDQFGKATWIPKTRPLPGQNYGNGGGSTPSHKDPHYWPQKLNSYYGESYSSQFKSKPMIGQGHGQWPNLIRPSKLPPVLDDNNYFLASEEVDNSILSPSGRVPAILGGGSHSGSSISNKGTMVDRISGFYTDYKLLTWVGVLALLGLAALGALGALYVSNPPTEVVTAREALGRQLMDPQLRKFVDSTKLGGEVKGGHRS